MFWGRPRGNLGAAALRVVIGRDSQRKAKGTGAGRDLESKPEHGQGPNDLHRPLQGARGDLGPWSARHRMLLEALDVLAPDSVVPPLG
jgi:hypothetical protein